MQTADAKTPPRPANDLPARSVLDAMPDFEGIGPLHFGMSAGQMRKAWGGPLYGEAPANDSLACYYLRPSQDQYDLLFMVEGDRFVRIDVKTESKTAPGAGRVGMSIAELRKLYGGRIKTAPNFYDPDSTDLRVVSPHGEDALLLFEANEKGVVTSWRIGKPQQVNYVEGCS
ncbi:MAG TPA: lectin [Rhodanobacteraceae bacterium]|nr:lectin [Rhodanobacteraceae bacterium]